MINIQENQTQLQDNNDPELNRKEAWEYTGYTPSTLATYDSRKTYDLQPRMKDRKIVYRQSVLDEFLISGLVRQVKRRKPKPQKA